MPFSGRGEAGFPDLLRSKVIAYEPTKTISKAILSYEGSGTLVFQIGTASSPGATITWESITPDVELTINTPNAALFYNIAGMAGAQVTNIRINYE